MLIEKRRIAEQAKSTGCLLQCLRDISTIISRVVERCSSQCGLAIHPNHHDALFDVRTSDETDIDMFCALLNEFADAGYIRRSSEMQKDNYSTDAQKRGITDSARTRGLPEPVLYEDDERSARGEQIANRPAFKRLLDDVQAGKVHVIMVHTLDRWSRNVMVTRQSFRILSERQTAFISLSEHIDYSTPEGRLQLTILAAFAAYFPDMLAKHTSKGKGERAA